MVTTTPSESVELSQQDRFVFPVDAEHGGIRLTVGFVFLLGLPIGYIMLNLLLPADGLNFVAFLGGIVLTFVMSQQLENFLKKRWKSGRQVVVDGQDIRIDKRTKPEVKVDGSQQVNVLRWRFEIKRRTRVAKGWYMVACALEQDGIYLATYTFVSPDDFRALRMPEAFKALAPKKSLEKERDMRIAGEQRRLFTAEGHRWNYGAEMAKDDFIAFLDLLRERFPRWMN